MPALPIIYTEYGAYKYRIGACFAAPSQVPRAIQGGNPYGELLWWMVRRAKSPIEMPDCLSGRRGPDCLRNAERHCRDSLWRAQSKYS